MLIWGSSRKMVAVGDGGTAYCAVCRENRNFTNFASYASRYIWYLVRWATNVQYHRRCSTCHNMFDMDKPTAVDLVSGDAVKQKSPVPLFDRWGWAIAIGAFALLMVFAAIVGNQDKADEAKWIAAPQRGDLYQVAIDRFVPGAQSQSLGSDYGVVRVEKVVDQTVTLSLPRLVYNRAKGARQAISGGAARSNSYYEGTIEMPLATIKARHADGTIDDVVR